MWEVLHQLQLGYLLRFWLAYVQGRLGSFKYLSLKKIIPTS